MEVRAPEAGLPIDKDLTFVMAVNQVLVAGFGARPVMIRFLVDSQRVDTVDGHFEAEYETRSGSSLRLHMKHSNGSMVIRVSLDKGQYNYSVEIDRYVTDDLVPVDLHEFEELVSDWFSR